jgi:pilus assembly protein FimV
MMRKAKYFPAVVALLMANIASALGLGEITAFSTINEPFHAEVRLLDIDNLSEKEIIAGFAATQDFERKQLDYHYFFNDFVFELLLQDAQNPRIKISSHTIVREPFIGFIVDVRWPKGRVQREYTLLLDKPPALENR